VIKEIKMKKNCENCNYSDLHAGEDPCLCCIYASAWKPKESFYLIAYISGSGSISSKIVSCGKNKKSMIDAIKVVDQSGVLEIISFSKIGSPDDQAIFFE